MIKMFEKITVLVMYNVLGMPPFTVFPIYKCILCLKITRNIIKTTMHINKQIYKTNNS